MFSEEDKKSIQEIIGIVHVDIKYINLEYVYSELERQFQIPLFSKYISYLDNNKKDENDTEDEEEYDREENDRKYEMYKEVENCEYELLNIFMCGLFIEKDLSEVQEEILEKIKEWLDKRIE